MFYITSVALAWALASGQDLNNCTVIQHKLDCRHRGFYQLPDLTNLSYSTTFLDFSNNKIQNLTRIKVPLWNRVAILDLHNNSINTFDNQTFTDLNNLRYLDMSMNLIHNLTTYEAFSGLTNVLEINISYNRIETVYGFLPPPSLVSLNLEGNYLQQWFIEAYDALHQLTNLSMNNNPFTSIDSLPEPEWISVPAKRLSFDNMPNLQKVTYGAFQYFPEMEVLYMSNNSNLREIQYNAFPSNVKHLHTVILQNYSLMSIPHDMMDYWSHLKKLDLTGNPFVCDNSFCWMVKQRDTFVKFSKGIR